MEVREALLTRRTIRVLDGGEINDADMEYILLAAMAAPNAFDERPWHFMVIRDAEKLAKLGAIDDNCVGVGQGAAALLVLGDEALSKIPGMWQQDCSAAAQNAQLAIHDLGLATVWLAIFQVPEREAAVRDILGIPDSIMPFALLPIGKAGAPAGTEERYDHERLHTDSW